MREVPARIIDRWLYQYRWLNRHGSLRILELSCYSEALEIIIRSYKKRGWWFSFSYNRIYTVEYKDSIKLISLFFFHLKTKRKRRRRSVFFCLTNVSNNKSRTYALAFGYIVTRTRKKKLVTRFVSRVVFYGALTSLVYSDCIVADKFQSSTVPVLTFNNGSHQISQIHCISNPIRESEGKNRIHS